ncbi:MAG: right-handed parallel beta-helix repeat-containing protein [Planctomycetota bacterium]
MLKNRSVSAPAAFYLALAFGGLVPALAAQNLYANATTGSDDWSGLSPVYVGGGEGPKLTLHGVRDAARSLLATPQDTDLVIHLAPGRYELSSALDLGTQDCHQAGRVVTWKNSAPAEGHVRISGGRKLAVTWQQVSGQVWKSSAIPEVANGQWWFRDLYLSGPSPSSDMRLTRARFPNAPTPVTHGVMTWDRATNRPSDPSLMEIQAIAGGRTVFTLAEGFSIPALSSTDVAELVHFKGFNMNRALVSAIASGIPGSHGGIVTTTTPVTNLSWVSGLFVVTTGERLYLENAASFVDEDNEWCLSADGHIFYKTAGDPNTMEFIAPLLDTLLLVEGAGAENRVESLRFEGLYFEHSNWGDARAATAGLPSHGFQGHAAGVWDDGNGTGVVPTAAIRFSWTKDCWLDSCQVTRTTNSGIHLDTGTMDDVVTHCSVHDIGANGIMMGRISISAAQVGNIAFTRGAQILDNYVLYCGHHLPSAAGIWVSYVASTTIDHNTVAYLLHAGILSGFNGSQTKTCHQNINITNNWVHHAVRYLEDGAGIFLHGNHGDNLGLMSNVSNNLVRYIGWRGGRASSLWSDNGTKNVIWIKNVAHYDLDGWCYSQTYSVPDTANVWVINNILMDGGARELRRWHPPSEGMGIYSLVLVRNIVVMGHAANITYPQEDDPCFEDSGGEWSYPRTNEYNAWDNMYYLPHAGTTQWIGQTWEIWNGWGNDKYGFQQQDPFFVDPSHTTKNYRLAPTSPCLTKGFQQIDVQSAGASW